jgi:hypothetical protein
VYSEGRYVHRVPTQFVSREIGRRIARSLERRTDVDATVLRSSEWERYRVRGERGETRVRVRLAAATAVFGASPADTRNGSGQRCGLFAEPAPGDLGTQKSVGESAPGDCNNPAGRGTSRRDGRIGDSGDHGISKKAESYRGNWELKRGIKGKSKKERGRK